LYPSDNKRLLVAGRLRPSKHYGPQGPATGISSARSRLWRDFTCGSAPVVIPAQPQRETVEPLGETACHSMPFAFIRAEQADLVAMRVIERCPPAKARILIADMLALRLYLRAELAGHGNPVLKVVNLDEDHRAAL